MKIAIPCENGEVMQHFGHATEFTVYTIEDIKPIEKETVTFDDTDHEKVAGGLKSRGVDLVICGNIGEGAHAAIDNAHMLLISGVTGNAYEAVDSFLQGNLELMTGDSSASAGGCGAGDWLYGTEDKTLIARPALHSYELWFTQPVTGQELHFTAPIPQDMQRLME